MAADTVENQLHDIREQLDIQGEAISKIAGVLSGLDGVDATLLGSYVIRLKRLHGPAIEAPTADTPASGPAEPEHDAPTAVPQPGLTK